MNSINPQSLKKLLLSLGVSMFLILIFLILKMFLQEEKKEVKLKSFKNSSVVEIQNFQEETQKESAVKEKNTEEKLLLLPKK